MDFQSLGIQTLDYTNNFAFVVASLEKVHLKWVDHIYCYDLTQ